MAEININHINGNSSGNSKCDNMKNVDEKIPFKMIKLELSATTAFPYDVLHQKKVLFIEHISNGGNSKCFT